VLIANVIAWPLAYYLMNSFLRNFHYRINIGVGVFLVTALITLAFALATVSFQAIKAALANPVEALRYE
jgi:putative ABC transport system permease protein